jgi:hypothetical protein
LTALDDWQRFPGLKILDPKNEHLRQYLVVSTEKLWPIFERLAQFLYEYTLEGGFRDETPDLQVRVSLPKSPWFNPERSNVRRWFSAFIRWGAPAEAWTHEEGSGESPEAELEIYENMDDKNLRKIGHCVILSKDLHVKTQNLGRL